MKFNCKKSQDRRQTWHTWFAWYPVKIAENDCRWLEKVERRGTYEFDTHGAYWHYEYKALK
jgi:hypothetical protein